MRNVPLPLLQQLRTVSHLVPPPPLRRQPKYFCAALIFCFVAASEHAYKASRNLQIRSLSLPNFRFISSVISFWMFFLPPFAMFIGGGGGTGCAGCRGAGRVGAIGPGLAGYGGLAGCVSGFQGCAAVHSPNFQAPYHAAPITAAAATHGAAAAAAAPNAPVPATPVSVPPPASASLNWRPLGSMKLSGLLSTYA